MPCMARPTDVGALGHPRSRGRDGDRRANRAGVQRSLPDAREAHSSIRRIADRLARFHDIETQAPRDWPDGGSQRESRRVSADLSRRAAAEFLGSAFLLAAVVGSGIMAVKLAGGNGALALLCNTLPTGAILAVLILIFGSVSGAHFNPAVTLA